MAADIADLFRQLICAILDHSSTVAIDGSFAEKIGPYIEHSSLEAKSAERLLAEAYAPGRACLLDFGCGRGAHREMCESFGYDWRGVDYLAGVAPGAVSAVAAAEGVSFYDGKYLPFETDQFDVVYSFLVFEHIQDIDVTFSEISRVLKPEGKLIGQVAYLEQMHDFSTFNFTPFGLKIASERNGLAIKELHPATDAFTFLTRRLMVMSSASDDTPMNSMMGPNGFFHEEIAKLGRRLSLDNRTVNLIRLLYSTHFTFSLEKQLL